MENFIVYGITSLFFFSLLPVYVSVYAYADSGAKYASVNVCLYRVFRLVNINSEEGKMKINGKDADVNPATALKDGKVFFDNLCLFKIIQLSDFGMESEAGAYASLAQSAFTLPLYHYISRRGYACKLKNYIVFNYEHGDVKYCAKAVSVINLVSALKILFMIFTEKLNEN